jgi:hypothetical protein
MENSVFYNNEAVTGTIFIGHENFDDMGAYVAFRNCSAYENKAVNELISISDTKFYIIDCEFKQHVVSIILSLASKVFISRSIFKSIKCNSFREGCLISVQDASYLEVDTIQMNDIFSNLGGAGFHSENSTINISNITSSLVRATAPGSIISAVLTLVIVTDSRFEGFCGNAFFLQKSTLRAEFLEFNNKNLDHQFYLSQSAEAYTYGTIYLESPSDDVLIHSSAFSDNQFSNSGGAIYLFSTEILEENSIIQPFIKIVNCVFRFNQVRERGGAIYSWNQNLNLEGCLFTANKATYGGGLYLGSTGIIFNNF